MIVQVVWIFLVYGHFLLLLFVPVALLLVRPIANAHTASEFRRLSRRAIFTGGISSISIVSKIDRVIHQTDGLERKKMESARVTAWIGVLFFSVYLVAVLIPRTYFAFAAWYSN